MRDATLADKTTNNKMPAVTSTALISTGTNTPGSLNTTRQVQRLRLEMDDNNNAWTYPVILMGASGSSSTGVQQANFVGSGADAQNISTWASLLVSARQLLYNGSTFDNARNSQALNANVADATTATYTGPAITTYNLRSAIITISVSSLTGTSFTPQLQYLLGDGSTWQALWVAAGASTSAVTAVLFVGPGVAAPVGTAGAGSNSGVVGFTSTWAAGANTTVLIPVPLPRQIRIVVTKTALSAYAATYDVQGMA